MHTAAGYEHVYCIWLTGNQQSLNHCQCTKHSHRICWTYYVHRYSIKLYL